MIMVRLKKGESVERGLKRCEKARRKSARARIRARSRSAMAQM